MALPEPYGMIFIPGGSIGHVYDLTVLEQTVRGIYANLKAGGWFVVDVRPPAYIGEFPKDGEVDFDLDEYDDGATVFSTGIWQHLEDGRVIRKWNKLERYVEGILTEVEVFDYRERLFEVDEIMPLLRKTGFGEIQVNKAYEIDVEPKGTEGIVFSAQRPLTD